MAATAAIGSALIGGKAAYDAREERKDAKKEKKKLKADQEAMEKDQQQEKFETKRREYKNQRNILRRGSSRGRMSTILSKSDSLG